MQVSEPKMSNIGPPTSLPGLAPRLGHTCDHVVQLYHGNQQPVIESVAAFLRDGYAEGENLIIIADDELRRGITRQLGLRGVDTLQAIRDQRLALFDSDDTLCWFMIDRQPDWGRFDSSVGAALRSMRKQSETKKIRAFGNMVDRLWKSQQFSAAIRLEQFWNRAMAQVPSKLFCAYEIDVFSHNFETAADGILCTHSHLQSAGLEDAIEQALREVLTKDVQQVREAAGRDSNPAWAMMPAGEKMVLWIRKNLADSAESILSRARQYYMLPV